MASSGNVPVSKIPSVIGTRTEEIVPLLRRWEARNRGVPWSVLVRRAVVREIVLEAGAGKRNERLIEKYLK